MKFFSLKKKKHVNFDISTKTIVRQSKLLYVGFQKTALNTFSKFFLKNGFLIKSKLILSSILLNANYFIHLNNEHIFENYPSIGWILEDIIYRKFNFSYIFEITANLIRPPFVIKSILIPKKLRKKTKQKYLIKIVYKNENKRLKSSYKQLCYYSNKFIDSKFNVRMYKSLMFSFVEWKESYLFRLKSMVFKKFFKF